MQPIQTLTVENFEPYGYLLSYDSSDASRFQVKVSESQATGWRMAAKKISWKSFRSLQKHPDSMESFTPLQGVSVMVVARAEAPEEFELFLLDQPVCLKKNTWHTTFCLSEFALVEVTENLEVDSDNFELEKKYSVYAG